MPGVRFKKWETDLLTVVCVLLTVRIQGDSQLPGNKQRIKPEVTHVPLVKKKEKEKRCMQKNKTSSQETSCNTKQDGLLSAVSLKAGINEPLD